MRVLDLGCGAGLTPQKLNLPADWEIVGVDTSYQALRKARESFPNRSFICAKAESLPFRGSQFECVISNVALPYTNIPNSLAEANRVLAVGGTLLASLHNVRFTLAELRQALPRLRASVYRAWVLLNGIIFHLFGRVFGESFQTERGMRLALKRAGFAGVAFRNDPKRWFVEAMKPQP